LLALSFGAPAAAHAPDTFGLGSRSSALAGAVSADAVDFSANYYNPAGLVLARRLELSLGYLTALHELTINDYDSQIDAVHGLVGGIVAPGKIGPLPLAVGLAAYVPDERLSRSRTLREDEARWVFYENRTQLLYLSANLAVRPIEWLAIGGGVGFLSGTRGQLSIRGTAVLPAGSRTEHDSNLTHEVDSDLTTVRFVQLGLRIQPAERIAFGLAFRDQAQVGLEMSADLSGKFDTGVVDIPARYELESRTVSAFMPRQLVLGVSAEPKKRLRVNCDLTWVEWSAYVSPVSRSESRLDVDVPPGLPLELPDQQTPSTATAPAFENRLVPRLGVEYGLALRRNFVLPLRVGYAFQRSPVPSQVGQTNFVDSDRHAVSAGAGFIWHKPSDILGGALGFDIHAQWSILPSRVTLKNNPADFVGDYQASGNIYSVGAVVSVAFDREAQP
jgi:long-chain fatty acid transport protein